MSVNNLYAFDSPNFLPLVEVGVEFNVNKKAIFRPKVIKPFKLHAKMSKNVGILRIFPCISSSVIRAFCQAPIKGIVLESYGAGNIPSNRQDILQEICKAVKNGIIIVNITQCNEGSVVESMYETGQQIAVCGVISGFDMTPEAALTKLSYVLSKTELTYQQKVEMMRTNIRGELTNSASIAAENNTLMDAVASSLNIQSPLILNEVTKRVFNTLLLYTIEHDDVKAVNKILDFGVDVNAQNFEGSTALHDAILKGNLSITEALLKKGANFHAKTRSGETPLLTAIYKDDRSLITLLKQYGAHITADDTKPTAEMLHLAAKNGIVNKVESLALAGADLNVTDEMKQSALHKAVLCNRLNVVQYLLKRGVKKDMADIVGSTPLDYAVKLNYNEISNKLKE